MSSIPPLSASQTVTQSQATQQLSDPQKLELLKSAVKDGAELMHDTSTGSYYLQISAQYSAAKGPRRIRVDRELAEAVLEALDSGGRISSPEVMKQIMPKLTDGGRYGDGEAVLARLLLSACDDRKTVKLGNQRVRITDKAEVMLKSELSSFWGRLGAKARWDKDPVAEQLQRA